MVKRLARQILREIIKEPEEIVKTAVEQATAKPKKEAEQLVQERPLPSKEEEDRREQLAKRRLVELEAELKVLREGREKEEAERRVEREEETQETFQVEIEAQKKEPPVVAAAKQRAGTGERRVKLASG